MLPSPSTKQVNEVLTMHVGPDYILAGVSLDANCDLPRGRTQALTEQIDREIRTAYPKVERVFVESHCEDLDVEVDGARLRASAVVSAAPARQARSPQDP
jgi:hypothetical protein